jgi:hypothetical protein
MTKTSPYGATETTLDLNPGTPGYRFDVIPEL